MSQSREEFYVPGSDPAGRINCDAVRFGNLVFLAGCGPVDADGKLVGGDDLVEQARQVFRNISTVLDLVGASFSDVLSMTTYLTNINEFRLISDLRREVFASARPASTLVEVSSLAVPGMQIEITLVVGVE